MSIQLDSSPIAAAKILKAIVYRGATILERTQDALFPAYCQLCDGQVHLPHVGGICGNCIRLIPAVRNACVRCGASLPEEAVPNPLIACNLLTPKKPKGDGRKGCANCNQGKWPARRIYAFGTYGGTLAKILVLLKRPGSESSAISLGYAMADWYQSQLTLSSKPNQIYDAIVPTPKFWVRRVSQRHNAAELLAESIGRKLGIPVWTEGILQLRPTSKQGILLASQRRQNVKGAFAANSRRCWEGKRILIVDDIVTSGSTLAEIATVLKKSNVHSVDGMCAARGIGAGGQGKSY